MTDSATPGKGNVAVDLEIRPTMRFILAGYAAVALLILAALGWWWASGGSDLVRAAVVVAVVLLLWPASRHVRRQRVRCRLENRQLRCRFGFLATTIKTIPLEKIQDVTVKRSLMQRLWGVGTLRIESAGQSSGLEIDNVDDAETKADRILAACRLQGG